MFRIFSPYANNATTKATTNAFSRPTGNRRKLERIRHRRPVPGTRPAHRPLIRRAIDVLRRVPGVPAGSSMPVLPWSRSFRWVDRAVFMFAAALFPLAVLAGVPGLPFVEDFSTTNLRDDARTTANWSIEEQQVFLQWAEGRQAPSFSDLGIAFGDNQQVASSIAIGDIDGDGDRDVVIGKFGDDVTLFRNNGAGGFAAPVPLPSSGSVSGNTLDVALGDIDQDGDLDLMTGNFGETNKLYRNLGNGTFEPRVNIGRSTETDDTFSLALGDINGDGALDLVVGNNNAFNKLYLNDRAGAFLPEREIGSVTNIRSTQALALGDVNGDGDLDLVVGNFGQVNRLFLNNGIDGFEAGPGDSIDSALDNTLSIVLGDLDGDGRLDVIAGNLDQTDRISLGNGNGSFQPAVDVSGEAGSTNSVVLGDVDRDGDLDLFVGNSTSSANPQTNQLFLNRGDGSFDAPAALGTEMETTLKLALDDLDGDGDLDAVAVNQFVNRLHLNGGSGGFASSDSAVGSDTDETFSAVLGDVDGDGDLDLITGNFDRTRKLYRNDGSGGFSATGTNVGGNSDVTYSVVLGDVDGDGDLDLIAGNFEANNTLYLNDGSGVFSAGTAVGSESDITTSLALGDVDGDGDLDLIAGNAGRTNKLYRNNGSGGFDPTGTAVGSDTDSTLSVVLGDVDGDGDLDLVAGNAGQANKLYRNDGSGGFDATGSNVGSDTDLTRSVVLGDVDGDGDLDLIAGNEGQTSKLYRNNGSGGFSAIGTNAGSDTNETYSVVLGDVDGDGDLDLIAGNLEATNKLYRNDGSGDFEVTGSTLGSEIGLTASVVLGDVDGDGDLDMIAGNIFSTTNTLYLNHSIGAPAGPGADFGPSSDRSESVAVGDVDGDGDLDVVIGNATSSNRLYLNDGDGGLTTGTWTNGSQFDTRSVALGDIDRDGDLDIVTGNLGVNQRYLNNNGQFFSEVNLGTDAEFTATILLEDLDRDGDLDLVAGNQGQRNRYYLNNGNGGFPTTGTALGAASDSTTDLAVGDVNGDGFPDLIAGNFAEDNRLFLNNRNGTFNAGNTIGTAGSVTVAIELGDVDGDGDLDLIEGTFDGPTRLYLNNGHGFFALAPDRFPDVDEQTVSLVLDDFDGDGDLDLAVGVDSGRNRIYSNNGDGTFSRGRGLGDSSLGAYGLASGDIDADGDLDLVVANLRGPNEIYETGSVLERGTVVSERVNTGQVIDRIILTAEEAPDAFAPLAGAIDYFVSNNGGSTWHRTRSGEVLTFPASGNDLRWKAELRTASPVLSPVLERVSLGRPLSVGGTVSGLRLPGLALQLNGDAILFFDQDGAYTFEAGIAEGTDYSVTEVMTPRAHSCTIANATGTAQSVDITNVNVSCSTDILFADGLETLLEAPIALD